MIRNEMVMSDSSRNSRSGEALIAATAAGAAAIGAVGAGAVCGVPAFSETVPVALAADLTGCSTEARDSVIAAGVSYPQTAIELENMDYLVEGVIGK